MANQFRAFGVCNSMKSLEEIKQDNKDKQEAYDVNKEIGILLYAFKAYLLHNKGIYEKLFNSAEGDKQKQVVEDAKKHFVAYMDTIDRINKVLDKLYPENE